MKNKGKKEITLTELSSMGGKARAKALTESRRKEISQKAIQARWAKAKQQSNASDNAA
jgi:hypothetical protein